MEKFRIFTFASRIYYYFIDYVSININKVDYVYKNNIEIYFLNLIENITRANINSGSIRNKYQKDVIMNINMIKSFNLILKNKSYKDKKDKFIKLDNMLNELNKMVEGWINEKS